MPTPVLAPAPWNVARQVPVWLPPLMVNVSVEPALDGPFTIATVESQSSCSVNVPVKLLCVIVIDCEWLEHAFGPELGQMVTLVGFAESDPGGATVTGTTAVLPFLSTTVIVALPFATGVTMNDDDFVMPFGPITTTCTVAGLTVATDGLELDAENLVAY